MFEKDDSSIFFLLLLLFIQKHIYNEMKNLQFKMKKIIRCKVTITPEIKLNEEQLQN